MSSAKNKRKSGKAGKGRRGPGPMWVKSRRNPNIFKPRGSRSRRNRPGGGVMVLAPGSNNPNEVVSLSSAYVAEDSGIGRMTTTRAPPREAFGDGTRVEGCELLCTMGTTVGTSEVFGGTAASGGPIAGNGNTIPFAPGYFSRLGSIARNFTKWIADEICLEYRPLVGTGTGGGFALGWQPDGSITEASSVIPSFTEIASFTNSMINPWWKPGCFAVKLLDKTLRYVDAQDNTSFNQATIRQASQGAMMSRTNAGASSTAVNGYLCVKYRVDFYGNIAPNNQITPSEEKLIRGILATGLDHDDISSSLQDLLAIGEKKKLVDKPDEKKVETVPARRSYASVVSSPTPTTVIEPDPRDHWINVGKSSNSSISNNLKVDTGRFGVLGQLK